jgi:hypothetical protein
MAFDPAQYDRFARPRYGTTNPEAIDNPMWSAAIADGATAYAIRREHDDTEPGAGAGTGQSSYREETCGPVWTWERFGRTTTELPDGRRIHIGGEHEDWYDIDFCIYNDVVVEHPDGTLAIFGYPKDLFPPTDFHTATLVGERIWIIGNLGYGDLRRPGETQVFTLDTRSFVIEPAVSAGEGPGWLHGHWAESVEETSIVVGGGQRLGRTAAGKETTCANRSCFMLDLATRIWRPLQADAAGPLLLGMDAADYARGKAPRFGSANPERVENPFWAAMARRRFSPRRARELFADYASDADVATARRPGTPPRPIETVVWTAEREDFAEIALDDGRRIRLGGTYRSYDASAIDNWVYSDAIVDRPDGTLEFYLYPPDLLPALHSLHVTHLAGRIFISGTPDRIRASDRPQFRSIVYELDPTTLSLRRIGDDADTPEDMIIGPGRIDTDTEDRLLFPIIRRYGSDPVREACLDLKSERWSMRTIAPGS